MTAADTLTPFAFAAGYLAVGIAAAVLYDRETVGYRDSADLGFVVLLWPCVLLVLAAAAVLGTIPERISDWLARGKRGKK